MNGGFPAMMERLPQERQHTAVVNLARAQAAFATTLQYVEKREVFGRPVGNFQHKRFTPGSAADVEAEGCDLTDARVQRQGGERTRARTALCTPALT
ncbi:acyl-CoA dehydrogenase family protein [Mycobacterium sp. UM_CSW]|uniref:acyl-CoA dehydrogenase family protein n=1 Tax=Mycobacterium sp. UM_CSW TaxID=1370119 RepID=UPI0021013754|nr:acyl-CoA dehydrogenase family protein [Mycobacterium sp. UM_CSW]